ncbi:hypothetical protein A8C56_06120 [Niabella ginsenosidivorans]|uniref:Uncharacterized protein n=1 Tax=Niabella ginsenosidivorans TaxID=1176587 RepID=A0A1A9I218_9BACT|nr:hypothetical protein A8C56_06120 [Niabella ginsenosidivorans]
MECPDSFKNIFLLSGIILLDAGCRLREKFRHTGKMIMIPAAVFAPLPICFLIEIKRAFCKNRTPVLWFDLA